MHGAALIREPGDEHAAWERPGATRPAEARAPSGDRLAGSPVPRRCGDGGSASRAPGTRAG